MRVIAYTSSSVSTPSFSCRISIVLDQGLPPGEEEVDITKSGELKKKKKQSLIGQISLPLLLSTVAMASISSGALDSEYSTKTNNSFRAVFTTRRN